MIKTHIEGSAEEWVHRAAMRELVAATNLVGVITQALVSETGPLLQAVAARLASRESGRRTGVVVSAGR